VGDECGREEGRGYGTSRGNGGRVGVGCGGRGDGIDGGSADRDGMGSRWGEVGRGGFRRSSRESLPDGVDGFCGVSVAPIDTLHGSTHVWAA
jgi:hypothetical protein